MSCSTCLLLLAVLLCSTSLALRPIQKNTRMDQINRQNVKCGVGPGYPAPANSNRISNGVNATKNSWPSMVAILFNGTFIYSGALIDEYHVLTSVFFDNVNNLYGDVSMLSVNLGMHKSPPNMDPQMKRRIRKMTVHPGYDGNVKNDIVILEMITPVKYRSSISPICLPLDKQNRFNNVKSTAVGWGIIKDEPDVYPSTLQQVSVETITNDACKKMHSRLSSSMICFNSNNGKGICHGDGGGPLFHKPSKVSPWIIIGIASFRLKGFRCGDERPNPSIYTRVTPYLSWIKEVTGKSRRK